jgi:hypothetical protein
MSAPVQNWSRWCRLSGTGQLREPGMVKTRYRGLLVSDLPALRAAAGL